MKSIFPKIGVFCYAGYIPFCEFAFSNPKIVDLANEPTNLKVLPKGTGDQLKAIMSWNQALWVKCYFCHKNKEGAP